MLLLPLAGLLAIQAPPPPPPFFGCSALESCLRVTVQPPPVSTRESREACASALHSASAFATDYTWAGTDSGSGTSYFRSHHVDQHDPKWLYMQSPTGDYSPGVYASWVVSRQRASAGLDPPTSGSSHPCCCPGLSLGFIECSLRDRRVDTSFRRLQGFCDWRRPCGSARPRAARQ